MTVKKPEGGGAPTVADAEQHAITSVAAKYWAPFTAGQHEAFNPALVDKIYETEIRQHNYNGKGIALLEYSHYLEHYLWPNFTADASFRYYLSIVIMVNEKFKERTEAWTVFVEKPDKVPEFIQGVLRMLLADKEKPETCQTSFLKGADINWTEKCAIITFLQHCFNSVEVDIVRNQMARLTSMHSWANLLPSQREEVFERAKKLRKYWNTKIEPELGKEADPELAKFERSFLWNFIGQFKEVLSKVDAALTSADDDLAFIDSLYLYCEKSLSLFVDLEALLPTRRFFNALIHASNLLTHCTLSQFIRTEMGTLFCQLVEMLKFYIRYDIDDVSGQPLSRKEVAERHHKHVMKLQRTAFRYFKDSMSDFALLNVGNVDSRAALAKQFSTMTKAELYRFAESSNLVPPAETSPADTVDSYTKEFLTEALILHCERRVDLLQQLNEQALFPTEKVIWDRNIVPNDHTFGQADRVLALDKLNLQFLTIRDYLMRNFKLFQMESTYEIRQDLEDVLVRLRPWKHETRDETIFGGWARMALPVSHFEIVAVDKPFVGQSSPSSVKANFTVNVGKRQDIRGEWESLRKHDVCFFVTVRATQTVGSKYDTRKPIEEQMEIIHVRGCEIDGMLDATGKVIEEYASYERKQTWHGESRSYRVLLDTNQYRMDMENHTERGGEDVYTTFNLVVRRDPKTNNFKAVLGTIRELLNTECVIPDWLQDVVIGFGNPAAAHYSKSGSWGTADPVMVLKTSADVTALDLHDNKMVHVNVRNLRLFNAGAFSNVYRGNLQLSEGRGETEIAIKKTWSLKDENKVNTDEINILKMLNRMNHKNTVKLLYFFCTEYAGNTCYSLIFEFLPLNLYQYMRQFDKKICLVETKMFAWQLFRGLYHLERANIIHRDIKPQNLLVDPETGLLKIGDFGSSCMDPKGPQPSYHVTRYYRPPELLLGSKEYGSEVDVWSAGCCLSELLGGRITFPGRSTAEQMELIMNCFGVPTQDEVTAMKASASKYRDAKEAFHGKNKTSLKKLLPVVSGHCTQEAVQLVQRILQFNPNQRLRGQELLKDAFFAELWDEKTRRPSGKPIECITLVDKREVEGGDKSMTGSIDLTHE